MPVEDKSAGAQPRPVTASEKARPKTSLVRGVEEVAALKQLPGTDIYLLEMLGLPPASSTSRGG
jgi:hypothetical protein